jgi:hypothetical protein
LDDRTEPTSGQAAAPPAAGTGASAPRKPRPTWRGKPVRLHILLIALFVAAGAGFAYGRGQDINYDQLNYHYYAAYAFETGRLLQDVAPAQVMHSYFSPVVYLPFYFMVGHLPPRAVGTILGAMQGLNLWLVFCIALLVTRAFLPGPRIAAVAAAVVISVASPMAISEVGTTMADLLTSLPVLAGVALLMRAGSDGGRRAASVATIGLAGALVGAAMSLKLTNASFALGLAAASLVGWAGWRDRLTAFVATGLGGVIGFAICGGSWYLTMWRIFRNPVFPYFNNVFRSPDYPSGTALFDAHYIPHSLAQAMSYPFLWTMSQTATAEISFRDIRFALLTVLGLMTLVVWLVRGRMPTTATPWSAAGKRLTVFVLVAMIFWMYEWSIQRYIVVLELLAGPAVIVLLQGLGLLRTSRACASVAVALALVCIVTTRAPNWGHLGWRKTWYSVQVPPTTSEHPVYFLADDPMAFVVPQLKPGASAIGYVPWENIPTWGDTLFSRRIHALLSDTSNDPVQTVSSGPLTDGFKQTLAHYGFEVDGACKTTPGRPWPLTWCTLVRASHARKEGDASAGPDGRKRTADTIYAHASGDASNPE